MGKLGSDDVHKQGKIIIKKLGPKGYHNEMIVYSKKLSYTPTLISHNPKTHTIKISLECCKTLKDIRVKDRKQYYPQIRKLFRQLKKDTGYYHKDLAPPNIIVNEKTGKVIFIDFADLIKKKKDMKEYLKKHKPHIYRFLETVGIIN